jgi:HlyD family secretion protein
MSTLLKSLFPAALCVATVLIVSTHLLRDTGLSMPEWHLRREAPVDVTLAEAAHHDLVHTVEATGKVEAEVEVKISAEVSGRIATLPIHEGDHVRKDQLLLQLDLALFEADVRSGKAKVQKLKESIVMDEADVEKAQRDMERNTQRLVVGRTVDEATAQDSVTTVKKNKAHLNMTKQELLDAESALAKAQEDLRKATIHSSLDGIVSSLSAKQGEVVLVGTMNNPGTVIMTLSEPGSLLARVRIDESKIPLVRVGQKALVHLPNNDRLKLTGTVKHISPKGSKVSALGGSSSTSSSSDVIAFETLIQLDSPPPEVRMEMTVNVEILVDQREGVLTVPAQSVLNRRPRDLPRSLRAVAEKESGKAAGPDSSRRYCQVVFVESQGVAHCRLVKTGIGDRGQVEILEGVKPGERVITGPYRNIDKLHDGTSVAELSDADDPDRGP